MKKFFSFIKKHINSWDEISIDDSLRLRTNILIFTLIISCLCIGTGSLIFIMYGISDALPTFILVIITISLFCFQLYKPTYSLLLACLFATLGFVTTTFIIWTGGIKGTGPLWLCILPLIATMVFSLRGAFLYDSIVMIIAVVLLFSPLKNYMSYSYSFPFSLSIPLSLLFVIICSFMIEIARYKAHKKLVVASIKLQNFAITDPLTEIYNRRALEMHFGNMNTKQLGLAFAMIDLDFFKRINDSYGHDVGDKTLSHVVRLTRQSIPNDASLYRWGGEEFLLVLRTSNPDDVINELERLRKKIENNPLIFADGLHAIINITVSIGGIYPNQDLTIEECIRLADVNLYEAKESGRNRVVVK